MRLIMMATGPFALPTFESLLASTHDVAVLVTRPQPPVRTRGQAPHNPMREAAESHGVDVLCPDDINASAARAQLAALRADLFVVCDYGQILSPATLSIPPLGGINLHGSVLPQYRGAAPVQWAVLNGDLETGVTVIHMTPKLDAGPTLVVRTTPIGLDETTAQLEPRLACLGVEPVHEAIQLLSSWDRVSPIGQPQNPALASRAPRLRKSDGEVDWSRPAAQIFNQVRALKPWPGTFTTWQRLPDQPPVRLLLEEVAIVGDHPGASSAPGTVLHAEGSELWIATGDGCLAIHKLQPAGKRPLATDEFLRGYSLAIGTRLGA